MMSGLAAQADGGFALKSVMTLVAAAAVLALLLFRLHPFLALNRPVSADVMVVEGWVPDYVVRAAARHFASGGVRTVYTSGLRDAGNGSGQTLASDAERCAELLVRSGVPRAAVVACPTPHAGFNRTSRMARQVRDRMHAAGPLPPAVNVVTLGPHARQTLLAYERLLGPGVAIGVISVPKDDYDPARWWCSRAGLKKTLKDFAGWAKEVVLGARS